MFDDVIEGARRGGLPPKASFALAAADRQRLREAIDAPPHPVPEGQ